VNGLRHPFSGALYEPAGHGRVRVTNGSSTGLFEADGRWVEGDLQECDPQLCGWVAGPRAGSHRVTAPPPRPRGPGLA